MVHETEQPVGSITSRVIRGAGWLMAWRFVSRSLGFISVLVLADLLVPGDFGIVAMASAVTGSIESLSQLGVRDALLRLADERRDYYDTAFTIQVGRGLLTCALIVVMSLFSSNLFNEPRLQNVLLVLAGTTLVSSFENIGIVGFARRLDFRSQFLLQAAPRIFGFIVTTSMAFVLRSYWALIIGGMIGKLIGIAMSYLLSPHRPRFGSAGWRYLLHFSFWSWAGSLAILILGRAEPFLLGPVLGVAAIGLITLAMDIAYLPISELLDPACAALFPGFAMANRSGSPPIAIGLSIAGALALVTIPFSIGVSACSGYLVTSLLGTKWEAAQPLIAILAWVCMFSPFAYVSGSVLSAQGQVSRVFASHALAAVLKIAILLAVRNTKDLEFIVLASMIDCRRGNSNFYLAAPCGGQPGNASVGYGNGARSRIHSGDSPDCQPGSRGMGACGDGPIAGAGRWRDFRRYHLHGILCLPSELVVCSWAAKRPGSASGERVDT